MPTSEKVIDPVHLVIMEAARNHFILPPGATLMDSDIGMFIEALATAGYKIMPDEPTPEIGQAVYVAWNTFGEDATMGPHEVIAIYRAMFAAA